jgi:hypothetical protein
VSGSRKSGDSDTQSQSENSTRTTANAAVAGAAVGHQSSAASTSAQPQSMQKQPSANDGDIEDDDEIDMWTVWGDLVKNWPAEMKKRPAYIKVGGTWVAVVNPSMTNEFVVSAIVSSRHPDTLPHNRLATVIERECR